VRALGHTRQPIWTPRPRNSFPRQASGCPAGIWSARPASITAKIVVQIGAGRRLRHVTYGLGAAGHARALQNERAIPARGAGGRRVPLSRRSAIAGFCGASAGRLRRARRSLPFAAGCVYLRRSQEASCPYQMPASSDLAAALRANIFRYWRVGPCPPLGFVVKFVLLAGNAWVVVVGIIYKIIQTGQPPDQTPTDFAQRTAAQVVSSGKWHAPEPPRNHRRDFHFVSGIRGRSKLASSLRRSFLPGRGPDCSCLGLAQRRGLLFGGLLCFDGQARRRIPEEF